MHASRAAWFFGVRHLSRRLAGDDEVFKVARRRFRVLAARAQVRSCKEGPHCLHPRRLHRTFARASAPGCPSASRIVLFWHNDLAWTDGGHVFLLCRTVATVTDIDSSNGHNLPLLVLFRIILSQRN